MRGGSRGHAGATFDRIASFGALLSAYHRARRAGRAGRAARSFDFDAERNLLALRDELLAGTYRPGPYRSFIIHEPKRRVISAAPFRDRVVHHALVAAIEPAFERRFIPDSYACRAGRGTHAALDRAHGFTRRYRYCLAADVVRFFPSVDHEILMRVVERTLRCERTLGLIRLILDGGKDVLRDEYPGTLLPGDDLFALTRARGLPIGNLTSQFLGNVFLDPLDHFVKERLRVGAYVRYADDFRLFGDDRLRLHEVRREMERYLAGFRLVLHDRKTHVRPCADGVTFLGFLCCTRAGDGGCAGRPFAGFVAGFAASRGISRRVESGRQASRRRCGPGSLMRTMPTRGASSPRS